MLRHLPESVHVHFGSHLSYIENFDNTSGSTTEDSVADSVNKLKLDEQDDRNDTQGQRRTRGVRLHIDKPARDAHPDYPSEPTIFECDLCIGCDVSREIFQHNRTRHVGTDDWDMHC